MSPDRVRELDNHADECLSVYFGTLPPPMKVSRAEYSHWLACGKHSPKTRRYFGQWWWRENMRYVKGFAYVTPENIFQIEGEKT